MFEKFQSLQTFVVKLSFSPNVCLRGQTYPYAVWRPNVCRPREKNPKARVEMQLSTRRTRERLQNGARRVDLYSDAGFFQTRVWFQVADSRGELSFARATYLQRVYLTF